MRVFIIATISILSFFKAGAQQNFTIRLTDAKPDYTPQHFYITNVTDTREQTANIGTIKTGTLLADGGLDKMVAAYIKTNMPQANGSIPVTMRITKFDITEKTMNGKRQFDLEMSYAYFAGPSKLVEYKGSTFAQSNGEVEPYVEKLIRKSVNDNFKELDSWVGKNKSSISATPTVEVQVRFGNTTDHVNQIPYSKTGKLYITDFRGEPDAESPGAAATLSGIGMSYESSTLRGKTVVTVVISSYFDKSRSWMKPHGKNITILTHEQRHFDITAIKACELKKLIEQTTFSPENYKEELKDLLNKVQQQGTDMQNQYDGETEHGTIVDQQEKWNKKVLELLAEQNCY